MNRISYPFSASAPGSGLQAAARSGNQGRLKVLSVGLKGIDTLEQLAEVKRVVVEVAKDCAVLNADDPLVLKMSGYTEARSICYVTVGAMADLAQRAVWIAPETEN
jgi:UDP-N-acetylmuramyl tripeptide synthase